MSIESKTIVIGGGLIVGALAAYVAYRLATGKGVTVEGIAADVASGAVSAVGGVVRGVGEGIAAAVGVSPATVQTVEEVAAVTPNWLPVWLWPTYAAYKGMTS